MSRVVSLFLPRWPTDRLMRKSGGASGDLTLEEALSGILRGSGLTYRYLDEKTVTIVPTASEPTADGTRASALTYWAELQKKSGQ